MGLFDRFFGPPTKEAFARKVTEALKSAGEQQAIHFDADGFLLSIGDGDRKSIVGLGNYYDEYCAATRSDRVNIIKRIAEAQRQAASIDLPKSFDDARKRLRPRLRERFYLEARRMSLELQDIEAPKLPHRLIGEHLAASIVYDLPETMLEIGEDQLAEWGVSFEEAFSIARENLWDISKDRLREIQPGLYGSIWQDNYDATRLLLHDLIWQYTVRGEHVVVTPNRDTLLVTGSHDTAGLEKLFKLAEAALDQPRPISAVPVRLMENEWKPFKLESWHELADAFHRLEVISANGEYLQQKDLLDALNRKKDVDIYVASFTAMQHQESGKVGSTCVWTEGVPALLPKTDQIAFVRPGLPEDQQVIGPAEWGKAQRELGDLMKPTPYYPERWRVTQFPPETNLRYLRP